MERRLGLLRPLAPWLYRWLFGDAAALIERVQEKGGPVFSTTLEMLGLKYECVAEEVRLIPRGSPLILASNHAYGLLEGCILGAVLSGVRGDFRFLAHHFARSLPQPRDSVIPIDPFGGDGARAMNRSSVKQCVQHLRSGGALVMFPAGRQASFRFSRRRVEEGPWNRTAAALARWTGAAVVPVFFHGRNSWKFYAANALHPVLGDALAGRELVNKTGRTIRVSIGPPLDVATAARELGVRTATEWLRARTLALADSRLPQRA